MQPHPHCRGHYWCGADGLHFKLPQVAEGWKIILLLRLSPIVPWNLLNIAMASTSIPFWQFSIASAIGARPQMHRTRAHTCESSNIVNANQPCRLHARCNMMGHALHGLAQGGSLTLSRAFPKNQIRR